MKRKGEKKEMKKSKEKLLNNVYLALRPVWLLPGHVWKYKSSGLPRPYPLRCWQVSLASCSFINPLCSSNVGWNWRATGLRTDAVVLGETEFGLDT